MDYPKTVLNVGLVNGKFIDEDNDTGQAGSLIPSDWGNAVTDELLAVIRAAGMEPAEMDRDQLQQAIQTIVRGALVQALPSQSLTAFTTTGTAPGYALSPVPAINGYVANQRFRVKFGAAGAGASTLNISGQGAKRLKQYDSAGGKVDAVLAAGQLADVEFDGADMVVLDPLPVPMVAQIGIQGAGKALALSATGTNAQVAISADELTLKGAEGSYKNLTNLVLSLSTAISGVNGLDAGVLAASTWYSVWVIWDGRTAAGLLSLSTTTPTLPAGYTHKARVGWIRTDATVNKFPLGFTQSGRRIFYRVSAGSNVVGSPVMASGSAGNISTPTWVAVSTLAFIPPTAISLEVSAHVGGANTSAIIAPNTSYSGIYSPTNLPLVGMASGTGNTYFIAAVRGSIPIEGPDIYWAAVGATLLCFGWEDRL